MKPSEYLSQSAEYTVVVDKTDRGFTKPVMRLTFTPKDGEESKAFTLHGYLIAEVEE